MTAIISGITGQDGSYLAKYLIERGYMVHGIFRENTSNKFMRLEEQGICDRINLIKSNLLDQNDVYQLIEKYKPDEFYNLAAQSSVSMSWNDPVYTAHIDGLGVLYILEAIRKFSPKTKLYQASTSEMFGNTPEIPQTEKTPFYPCSPYATSKLLAHLMCVNYRDFFSLFVCSGIMFSHESPMRGDEFVTRKITRHFADMYLKKTDKPLELGNIDVKRDWGFAGDYVEAMWMMLQYDIPDTYIIASGETHSVREFVEEAGQHCGFDIGWQGKDENEIGFDKKTEKKLVRINPQFYRPSDINVLLGDPTKAKNKLGWKYKINYKSLCKIMMEKDIERAKHQPWKS